MSDTRCAGKAGNGPSGFSWTLTGGSGVWGSQEIPGLCCLFGYHAFCCACRVGAAAIKLYLYGVSQLAGWEVVVRGCERCV